MKKILFAFVFTVFAITSYGGINLNARGATLTPDQVAALEQQLATMKATALALSSAAAAPVAPVPMTLSPQEIAQINVALDSLKTVLMTLQAQFATNPQLAERNLPVVIASLRSIGATLATITGTLGEARMSAIAEVSAQISSKPVAQAAPSVPPALSTPPKVTTPAAKAPAAPSAPLLSANQPQTGGTPAIVPTVGEAAPATNAETAAVSQVWAWKDMNWPLVAVVLLVVLAVALWLFWPEPENEGRAKGKGSPKSAPSPSVIVSTANQPRPTVIITPLKQSQNPAAQTPLSAAVAAPTQPQSQQRKPA